MSHLDEGQLHALLDGELQGAERTQAEAHLGACAECSQAYAEARALFREADALIASVDLPSGAARPGGSALGSRRQAFPWQRLAWAATIVLAVGLGWMARSPAPVAPLARDEGEAAAIAVPTETGAVVSSPAPAAAPVTALDRTGPATAARAKQSSSGDRELAKAEAPSAPLRRTPEPVTRLDEREADREAAGVEGQLASKPAEAPANQPLAGNALAQKDSSEAKKLADALITQAPRSEPSSAEFRGLAAAPAAEAAPRDRAARSGYAPLPARTQTVAPALREVPMEDAVRILGGSIRLLDGMTPVRVLTGVLPTGKGQAVQLVRVVYDDPPGRELWLDQQRPVSSDADAAVPGSRPTALLPGDTLSGRAESGVRSLHWLDQAGFQLGLTGFLPVDSLRVLARRVQ